MILGTGCLADHALDGDVIRRALRSVGLDEVLLLVAEGATLRALGDLSVAGVRAAWADRVAAVDVARRSKAPRLALEVPEGEDLLSVCRAFHGLSRGVPGLSLAVMNPASGPLADPAQFELLLNDLASTGLTYWHWPSRALLSGHGDAAWIDRLSRHLVGMSLDDVSAGEPGLPPGAGELDLAQAAALAGRSLSVALDTDPLPDVSLLKVAIHNLHAAGFP